MVLFKAVLSPYEGLGAIYVPPVINKYILIMDTGLVIVCGPHGELCACYHNGLPMSHAETEVSDLDFLSCWLDEQELVRSAASEVVGTCDIGHSQQGWGHFLVPVARLLHQLHARFPRLGTACLSLPFLFSKICVRVGDQFA